MKNDAFVIYCWDRCRKMGENLGLSLGCNTESIHVKGQIGEEKVFYTCDTVREMIGYLEGLTR